LETKCFLETAAGSLARGDPGATKTDTQAPYRLVSPDHHSRMQWWRRPGHRRRRGNDGALLSLLFECRIRRGAGRGGHSGNEAGRFCGGLDARVAVQVQQGGAALGCECQRPIKGCGGCAKLLQPNVGVAIIVLAGLAVARIAFSISSRWVYS
jgi:hypothetical protein